MPERSVTLVVGDSGLGKTPWSMMLGISVAAGLPFLGMKTIPGSVLYCDAESGIHESVKMLEAISGFLELDRPPDNFKLWSPNFDPRPPQPDVRAGDELYNQVELLKPDLVVADPLRAFWPDAEEKARDAMAMYERLRRLRCSWVLNHHRRKKNHQNPVNLEQDRHSWFEEAAGSLALVNGSDVRLGLEPCAGAWADLVLAGFVRSIGWIGSRHLAREYDTEGEPRGYRLLTGIDELNDHYRDALKALGQRFRFKDAQYALGGKSASNTAEFLKQCQALGCVRKDGQEYVKGK